MPQDLAALLVEEGAVSQADMERAVTRQAQEGGALDTALLELELVGEGHLRSFLSHASGLPPVPPGALSEIDPRARRVFPARVAERHRLAPFALDGRELSVVAVHPIDAAAIDEIGFMLSLTLVPHVGLEWRVLDLIHRLYGGQMPVRLARLAERERNQGAAAPPSSPAAPPEPAPGQAAAAATATVAATSTPSQSLEDAFFAAGEEGAYSAPSAPADGAEGTPAPAPAAEARGSPPHPALSPGGGEGVSPEPTAPAPQPVPPAPLAVADEASFAGLDDSDTAIVAPEPPLPREAETTSGEPQAEAPAAEPPAPRAPETSFAEIEPFRKAPSGFARDESEPAEPLLAALELAVDAYDALWAGATPEPTAQSAAEGATPAPVVEEPPAAATGEAGPEGVAEAPGEEEPPEPELPPARLDRTAPPGWSIEDALGALASAVHRDEVVLTALRFARDFFEFSALFAVTRDAVVGHDALGSQEDPRPHARGTAIYAEDPGIVRTVLETRAPYLGPVVRDAPGTTNILDGLWRGTPRTVLLYPILVGDRPVAVLYADNGEAPVSARRLSDLLLVLSTVGGTFERIIRARKKRRPRDAARPAPAAAPTTTGTEDAIASEPAPSWMAPPPDAEVPPAEMPIPEAANEPAAEPVARSIPESPPHPSLSPGGGEGDDQRDEEPPPAPSEDEAKGEGSVEPEPPPQPALSPGAGEGENPAPAPAAAKEQGADRGSGASGGRLEAAIALLLAGGQGPPDRVAPIVDLLLDSDREIAAAAREALAERRSHPGLKPVPERLRRGLLSGIGDRPVLAALALGALRDAESIPILIQAFEGGSPEGARAASEALTRITLQRLGPSAQKWLRWWKVNRAHSRSEWLFAALTSEEPDLRAAAAEELRAAGAPPVHYAPDLPASELAAAARAWWTWWSHQGLRI